MKNLTQSITPRQLFLIDSIGALISAVLLGIVWTQWNDFMGMPKHILWILSAIAGVFCLSSMLGFWGKIQPWQSHLKAIAIANWAYCALTASLILDCWQRLTVIGFFYFIGEIILITLLAFFEWQMAR